MLLRVQRLMQAPSGGEHAARAGGPEAQLGTAAPLGAPMPPKGEPRPANVVWNMAGAPLAPDEGELAGLAEHSFDPSTAFGDAAASAQKHDAAARAKAAAEAVVPPAEPSASALLPPSAEAEAEAGAEAGAPALPAVASGSSSIATLSVSASTSSSSIHSDFTGQICHEDEEPTGTGQEEGKRTDCDEAETETGDRGQHQGRDKMGNACGDDACETEQAAVRCVDADAGQSHVQEDHKGGHEEHATSCDEPPQPQPPAQAQAQAQAQAHAQARRNPIDDHEGKQDALGQVQHQSAQRRQDERRASEGLEATNRREPRDDQMRGQRVGRNNAIDAQPLQALGASRSRC